MFCFRKCLCLPSSLPFVVRVFSLVDFGFAFHTSSSCVPAPPSVPNRHGSAIQAPPFRLRHVFPTRTALPSKPNFCGSASASVCSAKRLFPLKKTIVSKLLFSFWQLMFCFRKRLCLPSSLPFVVRVFSLVDFGFAFHTHPTAFRLHLLFPTDTAPPSKHHLSGSATSFQPARLRHLSLTFAAPLPQASVPNIHGSTSQAPPFRLRHVFPTYTAPPSKHHLSGSATSFQHARLRRLLLVSTFPVTWAWIILASSFKREGTESDDWQLTAKVVSILTWPSSFETSQLATSSFVQCLLQCFHTPETYPCWCAAVESPCLVSQRKLAVANHCAHALLRPHRVPPRASVLQRLPNFVLPQLCRPWSALA